MTTSRVPISTHGSARHRAEWLILLLGLIGLFFTGSFYLLLSGQTVPRDARLREQFTMHKAAFVRMRDMIVAEPLLAAVGPDWLGGRTPPNSSSLAQSDSRQDEGWSTERPDHRQRVVSTAEALASVGLSSDRYQEYLRLLGIAGAKCLEWDWMPWQEPQAVRVIIASVGLVPRGQTKSLEYFPNGIPRWYVVVDDTDTGQGPKGDWYSPLGDGWYIRRYCW